MTVPLRESNNGALALGYWGRLVLTTTLTSVTAAALAPVVAPAGGIALPVKAFGPGFIEYKLSGAAQNTGGAGGLIALGVSVDGGPVTTLTESIKRIAAAGSNFCSVGKFPVGLAPGQTDLELVVLAAGDGAGNATDIDPTNDGENLVVMGRWVREAGEIVSV